MDLGFARFLEMFEERFGGRATKVVLAILGLAVAFWGIGEVVEKTIYFYGLIKSAHFLTALKQENAATHIMIFVAQIAITFLVLAFIWQWFYRRGVKVLEKNARARVQNEFKAFEAKALEYRAEWAGWEKKFDDVMAKHQIVMQLVPTIKNMMEKSETAVTVIRELLEKKAAENSQSVQPDAAPTEAPKDN